MNSRQIKWILSIALFLFVAGLFYLVQGKTGFFASKKAKANPCGIDFPKATGHVNDFTNLFTPAETHTLDSFIGLHEKETTNQLAIITIDSMMLGKCDIEQYTLEIANEWGVGQKGKNNGVLIGIAPGLRQMRIQNGYGIEKIISNTETKTIIDSFFIPEFKSGNYFKGTINGLSEIIKRLNQPSNK